MSEERELTYQERFVLEWLSKEDGSSYGECRGEALNGLRSLGLVLVEGDHRGSDYDRVCLSEKGWRALEARAA